MKKSDLIALDESMRHKDKNGHLIVKETVITKESVDPYYGRDIPNYEALGLDPDKIYHLYRPLEEIEKAIDTYKGKQLLIKHTPVSSTDTKKDVTVGAIGSDLKIKDGKLYGDMTFWDQEAIDLIESKKLEQLSAGYGYEPIVQSGDFEGTPYDIRMTNLHGNHVALVKSGRIGNDAIICDEQTVRGTGMYKFKKGSMPKIVEAMKLALDSDFTEESVTDVVKAVDEAKEDSVTHDSNDVRGDLAKHFDEATVTKIMGVLGGVAGDEQTQAERDNESEAMRIKEREEREAKDRERDREEANDSDDKNKPAMDAAIIEQNAVKKVTALFEAREDVKPLVGVVAMDSAESVYQYALEQKGVSTKGIDPSAYKAMVGLLKGQSKTKPIAMDSAINARENARKLAPHIKL